MFKTSKSAQIIKDCPEMDTNWQKKTRATKNNIETYSDGRTKGDGSDMG